MSLPDVLTMPRLAAFAALAALAAAGLGVRLWPFRANALLGVDNWYWLLCAEAVKKSRKLPPRLPYFMLEIEEQWYPPLYSGLLALVPLRILERHGGKLAQLIDLLHALLIFLGVLCIGGGALLAGLAGLSYILAQLPLQENMQLQPRGLANVILTLGVLGIGWHIGSPSIAKWFALVAAGVILLLLHKMNAQMWAVYLLGFSIVARDWTIAALLPASIAAAIVVSGGFYIKVLRAHWDIVAFWHRNIRRLGSHQYYESSRYLKDGFRSTAVHRPGLPGLIRKLAVLVQCNVFIVMAPLLVWGTLAWPPTGGRMSTEAFLWWWLGITCLWAVLTTVVPHFLALGAGVYYLYQSFFPLLALAGLLLPRLPRPLQAAALAAWGAALAWSAVSYGQYCRRLRAGKAGEDREALQVVLERLRAMPGDGVLCVPFALSDCTAYWTRKRVLWGGHGYGFRSMLQPCFPVMERDIASTLSEHGLNYVIFRRGSLESLSDIGLEAGRDIRLVHGAGGYELYQAIRREA